MKTSIFTYALIFILMSCNSMQKGDKTDLIDYHKTETAEEQNERMQWWKDAGFGMFIHWGLYSIPAGKYKDQNTHAEWIQETANIPVEEYELYASQFNPVKYDPELWVRMAKEAGMKYIVITSKHHDGFCLWDSKVSDYDVMDRTPYKKDLLKELADACQKEDIILCFYYSIMDWHHPQAQGLNYPEYNYGKGPNPEFSSYVEEYMYPQLEELMTGYGKLGVLWFDGEWITEWTEEQGKALYNHLRNRQADLIINNRVGKGRKGMQGLNAYEDAAGDFGTPEQEIIEGNTDLEWESCMTMNDHWGFNQFDRNFKSTEVLIHNLIDIAAKGGNYLLNVGPKADGSFPDESIQRLQEIGEWMQINGEVIHNSRGTRNFKENDNLFYIQSKDATTLYAVLTNWPGNKISLKYAKPNAKSDIFLLGYEEALKWTNLRDEGIEIELPSSWQIEEKRPVKHAYVLKIKGRQAKVAEPPQMKLDGKVIHQKSLFSDKATLELFSETDDAQIYYTLDGSDVEATSPLYSGPIELKKSTLVTAVAFKEGYVNSLPSSAKILSSKTFKKVDFKYPYNKKYSALGNLSIGDGLFGNEGDFTKNWLGFEGTDMIATIDLGDIHNIKYIKASFLENIGSWIFLPEKIEISTSVDGTHFETRGIMEIKMPYEERKANSHIFNFELQKEQCRFLRLSASNIGSCPDWHPGAGGKSWIFIDEIIVE